MKQYITIDQLNELSEKGKDNYAEWRTGIKNAKWSLIENIARVENVMGPSIGEMIEFLSKNKDNYSFLAPVHGDCWSVITGDLYGKELRNKSFNKEELCDALWEAVKEILNKTSDEGKSE